MILEKYINSSIKKVSFRWLNQFFAFYYRYISEIICKKGDYDFKEKLTCQFDISFIYLQINYDI